jgi:hypothetical protein
MVLGVNQTRRVMLVLGGGHIFDRACYAAYSVTAPARLKITPAMSAP